MNESQRVYELDAREYKRYLDMKLKLKTILELVTDGDNRDEMSSDAQEWCDEILGIVNG